MPTVRNRNGRFQAQVRIVKHGEIVYEESATFDTQKQAYTWGWGIEEQYAAGTLADQPSAITLAACIKEHVKALEEAGKGLRGVANSVKQLLDSNIGKRPIMRLEASDYVAWGKAYAQTRSPATVLHAFMLLRSVYETARIELKVKVNIAEVADAIKHLNRLGLAAKSVGRDRRVSDDEIDRIASYHEKLDGTMLPMRTAMELAVALPRRSIELFSGMRWSHYDGRVLKLYDTKDPTKVRNERVPVPPIARRIIDSLPRPKADGPIMPYGPRSISVCIWRSCKMVGIEDLHLHDFRHEGVSRLFEMGLDIPRVSMISGHQSWATLQRYTHLRPSDVVDRMDELETD